LWRRANFGRPSGDPLDLPYASWLRRHAGRLIEAVDPGPGPDIPRVPLGTLLDDADSSGVAAGPDRAAEAGRRAPRASR